MVKRKQVDRESIAAELAGRTGKVKAGVPQSSSALRHDLAPENTRS
jgi:hypothetical protein